MYGSITGRLKRFSDGLPPKYVKKPYAAVSARYDGKPVRPTYDVYGHAVLSAGGIAVLKTAIVCIEPETVMVAGPNTALREVFFKFDRYIAIMARWSDGAVRHAFMRL